MRLVLASVLATCLLASTACSDDPAAADDDADDDSTSSSSGRPGSSSGSSSGRSSSGSTSGSSSGRSSSGSTSGGGSTSSGGSSSGGSSSGEPWPGPSGTAIAASVVPDVVNLYEDELAAHTIAAGADDGSFAVLVFAWPAFPALGGATIEKRAADHTLLWRKTLEYTPTSSYTNLAMDAAGNVYVAANVSPLSGLTLGAEEIPNVRANEPTTDVGECVVLRLAAADGAKAWHGHVTLKTGLTLAGDVDVQCRGLAARGDQVVVSGVFPTKDIFYVQGGATTSAVGTQSDLDGNVSTSFAISLASATGVSNTVNTLVYSGSGEFSSDGTALATDGRTLLHGAGRGTNVRVGTTGSGELLYTPTPSRDPLFAPVAFLNLATSPVVGRVEAQQTLASPSDPTTTFPQVVALPNGAALFGASVHTNSATTFYPPNAGTSVALAGDHEYFVLTQMASDASAGESRALDLGEPNNFAENFLASGPDGSVVLAGVHEDALAFGAGCDTSAVGDAGSYLVSFGTTPLAGCKFAIALPAGVYPARAAIGADGRIFLAGLYSQAATFRPGVVLPEPVGAYAPFLVSFVP